MKCLRKPRGGQIKGINKGIRSVKLLITHNYFLMLGA